jgi:hypothetical protein
MAVNDTHRMQIWQGWDDMYKLRQVWARSPKLISCTTHEQEPVDARSTFEVIDDVAIAVV